MNPIIKPQIKALAVSGILLVMLAFVVTPVVAGQIGGGNQGRCEML